MAETLWSEPVRLTEAQVGIVRDLAPDEGVQAALAAFLGVVALRGLRAQMVLSPTGSGYRLEGQVDATITQICGVTLEPFDSDISARIDVDLVEQAPPRRTLKDGEEYGLEDLEGPDVIENGQVDLARYAIECLSLEIDPFPRKPGAVFSPPETRPEPGAFAGLAGFKPSSDTDS